MRLRPWLTALLCSTLVAAQVPALRDEAQRLKRDVPPTPVALAYPHQATLTGWLQELCRSPHRRPGTPAGLAAEAWFAQRLRDAGVGQVTSEPVPLTVWSPTRWELSVGGQPVPCSFMLNAGFTPAGGLSAPLVYAGAGGFEWGLVNAKGKLVVAEAAELPTKTDTSPAKVYFTSDPDRQLGPANQLASVPFNLLGDLAKPLAFLDVQRQAAQRGAVGLVVILRDERHGRASFYWPPDASTGNLPGVFVARAAAEGLRAAAKAGRPATLTLTGTSTAGEMHNVWGVLPGASTECILLTSPLDSGWQGAVDSGTGCVQLLAQAAAWSRVPQAQRPATLVFLAAAGHLVNDTGAKAWAAAHADLLKSTRLLLSVEHLGGREVEPAPGGDYRDTGRPQAQTLYVPHDAGLLARTWAALDRAPQPVLVVQPPELGVPLTSAAPFINATGGRLRYVSWTSGPLYLRDDADTVERVDPARWLPTAATLGELVQLAGESAPLAPRPDKDDPLKSVDHQLPHATLTPGFEGKPFTLHLRERVPLRPAAHAVLCLHGYQIPGVPTFDLPTPGGSWLRYFAERGWDAYALDLTGYGDSTRPAPMAEPRNLGPLEKLTLGLGAGDPLYRYQLTSTDSDLDDIDAAVDFIRQRVGVDRVSLLGSSLGAGRAMAYAAEHQGKVERIVAQGWSLATWWDPKPAAVPPPGTPLSVLTKDQFASAWRGTAKDDGQLPPGAVDTVWQVVQATDPVGAQWGRGLIRAPSVTLWGWNKQIITMVSAPTMLITGDRDSLAKPPLAPLLDQLTVPYKVGLVLQGASQAAYWEQARDRLFKLSFDWLANARIDGHREGSGQVAADGAITWEVAR